MQTVKALIINSSSELNFGYLNPLIDLLKSKENPDYPDISRKDKTSLSLKYNPEHLSHNLSGHGNRALRNVCSPMTKGNLCH